MPYLSSYKLETVCDKNSKKYSIIEGVSLGLKLVAILLLIIMWRYFYIAIAVWVVSIILGFFKRNLIYKYVCSVDNGVLLIKKEYNAEKSDIVLSADIKKDVADIEIGEADKRYYEHTPDMPIKVLLKDGQIFSIPGDTYFFALLDYYRRDDGLSR